MHVLHLIHSFLPVTQNWIYSQLKFNTYCRASVLCQYRRNEAQFPHDAVYPAYRRLSLFAWSSLQLVRLRERYFPKHARSVIHDTMPDILHAHFAFEACRHSTAVRESRLPLVTTFYGLDISMLPRRSVWRRRYAELFKYGAAFIVEGDFMAARLTDLGCPASKINVIAIGVDIKELGSLPKKRDPKNAASILFVGLDREKKGALDATDAFVAVAARHPEIRFDLIGDGRYRMPVHRRLRKAGYLDRCTFHGYVPVSRCRELLSDADIVLAPSVTAANGDAEGGAPVSVIEAQAAGIPVVGTLHCDIPMVVQNGETGLLCAERDTITLAANLERLVGDTELRRRMGAAGAQRAAERHDIRKQVEKIYEIYIKCTSCG
jgi:colanic acid/amylovoran biosynthesis glycosyltransferase